MPHVSHEVVETTAAQLGHQLDSWRGDALVQQARCARCAWPAATYNDGSTSGLALELPCPRRNEEPLRPDVPLVIPPDEDRDLDGPQDTRGHWCACGRRLSHRGRCRARRADVR